MSNKLTERWQNVYEGYGIDRWLSPSKEGANHRHIELHLEHPRTHYLKSYWTQEGVIERVELIKIEE